MQDWQEFVAECWRKKNIGKPYAGKPHVRFDEGAEVIPLLYSIKERYIRDVKALDFRHFSASGSFEMVEWTIALR